jgi:hypothetical protein
MKERAEEGERGRMGRLQKKEGRDKDVMDNLCICTFIIAVCYFFINIVNSKFNTSQR